MGDFWGLEKMNMIAGKWLGMTDRGFTVFVITVKADGWNLSFTKLKLNFYESSYIAFWGLSHLTLTVE